MADYSGLVSYFSNVSGATSGYKFDTGFASVGTYASDAFSSGAGINIPSLASGGSASSFDTTVGAGGGLATAVGFTSALYDSAFTSIGGLRSNRDAGPDTPETYSIYGIDGVKFDQSAISDQVVAKALQASGVSDSFKSFVIKLSAFDANNTVAVEELRSANMEFVESVGNLAPDAIRTVGDRISTGIRDFVIAKAAEDNGRVLNSDELLVLNRYADGYGKRVTDNLTIVSNVAKSMITEGPGSTPYLQFSTPDSAAGTLSKFSKYLGEKGARATAGRDSLERMGIYSLSGAGESGAGSSVLAADFAVDTIKTAIEAQARRNGVYHSLDGRQVASAATQVTSKLLHWADEYSKSLAKLENSTDGGITYRDLEAHMRLIDEYGDLPVIIRDNGQLDVRPDAIASLLADGRSAQAAQVAQLRVRSDTAGNVLKDTPGLDQTVAKNYSPRFQTAADGLSRELQEVQAAGNRLITIPNSGGVTVTAEELRKAIASGRGTIMVGDEVIPLNSAFLFDERSTDAARYADYLDKLERLGADAPRVVSKLAGDTKRGLLWDTNVLTGEKTMNGSGWLQLLLAAGGIVTPVVSMLQEQRNTKKNREYMDRVRQEDREFQERLMRMQLESAETQASIAADSRNKAVATGGSRTSVTINSPTQSK